ncbi:hypothetical protein [Nocardia terpenica]|nr:hypothetical protein [Nocardia terpenica]NQE93657.1 hypothetical protein [Nocardia terpenica]
MESSFKVVDRRGKQRFLFETRKPPVILGGKTYPAQTRRAPDDGSYMLFNDENGDEKGGILAAGDGAQISFDYPNGDAIHLGTGWQDKTGGAGLEIYHPSDLKASADEAKHPVGLRLFVDNENGTGLTLCDQQGRPRIQLRVAMDGTASIAIFDEQGAIVKQL